MYVAGVFLDLAKAFDSLNHAILLDKLPYFGIRGAPFKLFESYLINRQQCVYCNNNLSTFKVIRNGVPQGSVLGPVLNLLYINDLPNISNNITFTLFADDTNFIITDRNLDSLRNTLNSELLNINNWIKNNKLKINVKKTKLIIFQNRSLSINLAAPIYLDGVMIDRVHSTKFWGVIINDNINWNQHISSLCINISKFCGVLYRVRDKLTTESIILIYYTLCYSKLFYCESVWGCTWPSFVADLFKVQKAVLRIILYKKKFDSTENILKSFNLMNFYSMHKFFVTLSLYEKQ